MSFSPGRKHHQNKTGFTLIETLIVMLVTALLVGAGLAAYLRFNSKRRVEQAALDFATYLKVQQKKADAGEKPSGCLAQLLGYQVQTVADSEIATTGVLCGVGAITTPPFNLLGRAQFDSSLDVTFMTLGRPSAIVKGDVLVQAKNFTYKVMVNDGGVITLEEVL